MSKLHGEVLTLPKVSGSVSAPKSLSGNVGAKTINIGGKGDDGATFIPSVSVEGVISWTNDKDLPNPEPVNIKGAKGDKGDKGDRGLQGVQGIQGERGEQGPAGVDGASGVYVGTDTPPDDADVWVDPNGSYSFKSETWKFTLEDETTVEKTVVLLG